MTKGPTLAFFWIFFFIRIAGVRVSALQETTQLTPVVSEPDFDKIFKEATSLICLSHWIDRVLFIQSPILNQVFIHGIDPRVGVEVAYDKESERRGQNTDCLATKLAKEDRNKL